jgi:dipeptidyl aminopeptidase/acylaminoacyl peptidase
VSSDETGVYNAYRLDVESGQMTVLTASSDRGVYVDSWFPNDDRFIYQQDGNGDELTHVFVMSPSGESTDLTPGEGHKAGFAGWSSDGSEFFIYSNERDGAAFDMYRYSAADYSRTMLYENTEGLDLGAISSDGRWVVYARNNSNADTDLFLIDVAASELELVNITPHEGNIEYSSMGFTPDSRQFIYSTNEFGEFSQAWTLSLDTGARQVLIAEDWDVMYVGYSPSGRYRVSGINNDARTVVTLKDLTTGRDIVLKNVPEGDLAEVRFNRDESAIAFGLYRDTAPYDVYHMPLNADATRLTRALNPVIESNLMVEGDVVRFASYDGLQVPGILYKPREASAESPVPALVWVHGGPGGQSRKGYSAVIQHLVNHGYAVYQINNRGSSGYGKTFFHLDDLKHGEADLGDVVASREFLAAYEWIDGNRVGIIGGSYGGYMVAAALAFEPESFEVGINIFGVTNWLRTLESIPPWWGAFRTSLYAELGDPATDTDRLTAISPLFHAQNIVKPLLVVQGANDPRVLQVESDELVEEVRANNIPVEYVLFADEGHGFRKRVNRVTASEAYLSFLEQHL